MLKPAEKLAQQQQQQQPTRHVATGQDNGGQKGWRSQPYGPPQQPKGTWNSSKGARRGGATGKYDSTCGKGGMGKKGDPNRSRGPPPEWGADATRTPPTPQFAGGQLICFDHRLHGSCPGNCNKNHDMCPRLLAAGWYCFETTHPGHQCPGPF